MKVLWERPSNRIYVNRENICGLQILTVEAEIPLSVKRLIEDSAAVGFVPKLIILANKRERCFLIFPNRDELTREAALKTMNITANLLNRNDETAIYGGTKWTIDPEKVILHSPNHGFNSSLTLKEIIRVIGMKQFFAEVKQMQKVPLLPLPGQVEMTLRKRNAKEAGELISHAMPKEFQGTYEVTNKGVKINFVGSL